MKLFRKAYYEKLFGLDRKKCDHCGRSKCKSGVCDQCGEPKNCIASYLDPYAKEINEEDVCMGRVCEDCLEARREEI